MSRSKTPPCSRECGQRVWFDWNAKPGEPGRSDFGKLRPLQVNEDGEMLNEIHDCPNSDYNKKQQQQPRQAPSTTTTTVSNIGGGNMEAVLGNTMDIVARVEKLDTTMNMIGTLDQQLSGKIDKLQHDLDELISRQNQLVEHLVHNPLDDDGNSLRENPEAEDNA